MIIEEPFCRKEGEMKETSIQQCNFTGPWNNPGGSI
jgi:hypothetical protein